MYDYSKSSNLYDALYEYLELARLLRITNCDLILDVGCGLNHLKAVYNNVIGIDLARNSKADVIADARCLPFRDDAFDVVISVELIEHLEDGEQLIKEMIRVGKKVGISTVNKYTGRHDERHVKEYSFFELRRLFKKRGLRIMDYGYGGVKNKLVTKFRFLTFILPFWLWCEWFCIVASK